MATTTKTSRYDVSSSDTDQKIMDEYRRKREIYFHYLLHRSYYLDFIKKALIGILVICALLIPSMTGDLKTGISNVIMEVGFIVFLVGITAAFFVKFNSKENLSNRSNKR